MFKTNLHKRQEKYKTKKKKKEEEVESFPKKSESLKIVFCVVVKYS